VTIFTHRVVFNSEEKKLEKIFIVMRILILMYLEFNVPKLFNLVVSREDDITFFLVNSLKEILKSVFIKRNYVLNEKNNNNILKYQCSVCLYMLIKKILPYNLCSSILLGNPQDKKPNLMAH
jgi:hypothetical protein